LKQLVFLVEERSMEAFLEIVLPRILPPDVHHRLIPHEGASDLDALVSKTLNAWRTPDTRFIVVRDQHNSDCRQLKAKFADRCALGGQPDALVRIVCCELESWVLGDPSAIANAFGRDRVAKRLRQAKFRDPDRLSNAAQEMRRVIPGYQKIGGARTIAHHMDFDNNRSNSFRVFLEGVRRLATGP
jgi:hypothetical protein